MAEQIHAPQSADCFARPATPEMTTALNELTAKARAPKKAKRPTKRKVKQQPKPARPPAQHDAHVKKAAPFLALLGSARSAGHTVPLSFFIGTIPRRYSEVCDCAKCRAQPAHSTT